MEVDDPFDGVRWMLVCCCGGQGFFPREVTAMMGWWLWMLSGYHFLPTIRRLVRTLHADHRAFRGCPPTRQRLPLGN